MSFYDIYGTTAARRRAERGFVMDLTMSNASKAITLTLILLVFAFVGWRVGAPQSFQTALSEAGIGAPPAPITAATTPAPDQPAPAQPQGDSSPGH